MRRPQYQDENRTYSADRCRPVIEAVAAGKLRQESLVHGHYPGRRLPRGVLNDVRMLGFWDADTDQDWGLDWHQNEGIELTFLENGRLDFAVDQKRFRLLANDLTVTRPWQSHRVGNPHITASRLHFLILDVHVRRPHQPWQWPSWLVLTRTDREDLTRFLRQNEQPVWATTLEVADCFRRIGRAVEASEMTDNISRLTVFLNELFVLLLDMFRAQRIELDRSLTSTQRTVRLFWESLEASVERAALEWTVQRMARQCKLGVTRFTQCTKELTNLAPGHYLNHCRLKLARRMLWEHPELNVTQVALACGFTSGQYFATLFRERFGMPPSAYREKKLAGVR